MSLLVTCQCGAQWRGERMAHCKASGCHRTFSTVRNFDKHWRGREDRYCVDPATVGLVPRQHPGCVVWAEPGDATGRSRLSGGSWDTDQGGSVALVGPAAPAIGNGGES
jgi:hypothetical protein